MKSRTLQTVSLCVVATFCWSATAFAGTPSPGRNVVPIRGVRQEIDYLPARGTPLNQTVLFVPGVGGWRGWAVTIAETMASWGYDVYGIDTKTYLDGFSGSGTLTEGEVTNDMCELADWAANGSGKRVTFVGWSEGAGLGVLGAAGGASKKTFDGLITYEPKRFELVQASNHHFDGNHQEFFLELRNGLQWVSRASQASTRTVM